MKIMGKSRINVQQKPNHYQYLDLLKQYLDFFNSNLPKDKIIFVFPPANIIDRTIMHILDKMTKHKIMLLFTVIENLPVAFPQLQKISRIFKFRNRYDLTFLPAETKTKLFQTEICGVPNHKKTASYLAFINLMPDRVSEWDCVSK